MRHEEFGQTGVRVPVIGQGTWNLEDDDRTEAIAAIRRGLDLGLTHIDTAEMYGAGKVEDFLREALAGRRDEAFLVSKVLPNHASADGVVRACERSLQRLGTDRLDCYLLHWRGEHPLEETVRGFDRLVAAGKIRAWGVSNFDVDDLDELAAVAPIERCACNQVLLHLGERYADGALLDDCRRRGISLVAYSPFGQGDFPSPTSPGGRVLAAVAKARGASVRQVALAFLLREPGVFVIPKASSRGHVEDNAKAAAVVLEAEEIRRIEAAFPRTGGTLPTL